MPKKEKEQQQSIELSKQRVKKFFKRLDKSPLQKLMEFQTVYERVEAILKFAEIVGIPRAKLPLLINSLRKNINK